jgi:hypothetical protein
MISRSVCPNRKLLFGQVSRSTDRTSYIEVDAVGRYVAFAKNGFEKIDAVRDRTNGHSTTVTLTAVDVHMRHRLCYHAGICCVLRSTKDCSHFLPELKSHGYLNPQHHSHGQPVVALPDESTSILANENDRGVVLSPSELLHRCVQVVPLLW